MSKYYDFSDLDKHTDANIRIVISERGVGKTWSMIKKVLKRFHKYKTRACYVTYNVNTIAQYSEATLSILETLAKGNAKFLKRGTGYNTVIYYSPNGKKDNYHELIHFVSLSTATKTKMNAALQKCSIIVFDEFLDNTIWRGDPVNELLTIYDTIDRGKDTTIIYMMSNATTHSYNPFFVEWRLKPKIGKITKTYFHSPKGRSSIVIHINNNPAYQEKVKETFLGRVAGGTEYEKMNMKAEFNMDEHPLVIKDDNKKNWKTSFYIECSDVLIALKEKIHKDGLNRLYFERVKMAHSGFKIYSPNILINGHLTLPKCYYSAINRFLNRKLVYFSDVGVIASMKQHKII